MHDSELISDPDLPETSSETRTVKSSGFRTVFTPQFCTEFILNLSFLCFLCFVMLTVSETPQYSTGPIAAAKMRKCGKEALEDYNEQDDESM